MGQEKEIELFRCFLKHRRVTDFQKIHTMYFESLCFFAYGFLKDQKDAEDMVQDAFIKFWENTDLDDSNVAGFLHICVRNNCLMFLRKQKSQIRYIEYKSNQPDELWEEDESLRLIKAEFYREIMEKVESLPPKMRQVFLMSYVSKMKEKEIADHLSISVNSIKTHKQRAKKILKKELIGLLSSLLISLF